MPQIKGITIILIFFIFILAVARDISAGISGRYRLLASRMHVFQFGTRISIWGNVNWRQWIH